MDHPKTTTGLSINSQESITAVRMPKGGQVWINYEEKQQNARLTIGGVEVKRGEGIYSAFEGAELIYNPASSQHGEIVLQVTWGYVNE